MKKTGNWIALLTAIFVLLSFAACDSGSSSGDAEEIPDDVAELGGGAMELVGYVLHIAMDDTSSPPPGITIVRTGSGGTATLTNFSPTDEDPITITGAITVNVTSTEPLSLTLSGNCTFANSDFESLSITGSATWAEGESIEDGEPQSYTGSITIDGKKYSIKDMLEAVKALEDD